MVEQGGAMENILKMTKDTVKLEGGGGSWSLFNFLLSGSVDLWSAGPHFMKNFDFVKRGAKLAAYRNGCWG